MNGPKGIIKLGSVKLKSSKDVKRGEETSIDQLFSFDEQRKTFNILADTIKNETRIKVNIAKVGVFETTADTTTKRGKKVNCFMLLKRNNGLSQKIATSEDIEKGDKLEVTFEIV